jgi:hypothetical protein
MTMFSLVALMLGAAYIPAQAGTANFPDESTRRPSPTRPGQGEFLYRPMNHTYLGQNSISLNDALGLGFQHNGRRVEYVVLRARSFIGRGEAAVSVNGRRVTQAQQLNPFTNDYHFILPSYADEIGREIRHIQIDLSGQVTVEGVGLMLESRWGRPPGPIRPIVESINLHREFRGGNRLALGSLVNFGRYQGMRLSSVRIRAAARAGQSDATFCASRCGTIRNLSRSVADHVFPVQGEFVDRNAGNWFIDLRGNIYVESVILEFSR